MENILEALIINIYKERWELFDLTLVILLMQLSDGIEMRIEKKPQIKQKLDHIEGDSYNKNENKTILKLISPIRIQDQLTV